MTSLVEVIQHYQRSIDANQNNEEKLLHCINKLDSLPIKIEHLKETLVGWTVGLLASYNGQIGDAADILVSKWKAMVVAEEKLMKTSSPNNENETPKKDGSATPHEDEADEYQKPDHHRDDKHSKNKERSITKGKKESNSEREQKLKSLHHKRSGHKSSSTSSNHKSTTKDSESSERKRRRDTDNESIDFKSPQPKLAKLQNLSKLESSTSQEDEGAKENALKSPTTPSNNSTSTNKKDITSNSQYDSDSEAITHAISSKTIRTNVYEGIKKGKVKQVPTLLSLCTRKLQKNIDDLKYTGAVPFEVLKPVLNFATPQQLHVIEEYNPHLMGDSDVLWQQLASRRFRTQTRLENESWREMFIRSQDEEERKLNALKEKIKASQKTAAEPVRKTQIAFENSVVKPPRDILIKQKQYGTKLKSVATPASRVASLSNLIHNVAKTDENSIVKPPRNIILKEQEQCGTKLKPVATPASRVASLSNVAKTDDKRLKASARPKKAPLMKKTLQSIRNLYSR